MRKNNQNKIVTLRFYPNSRNTNRNKIYTFDSTPLPSKSTPKRLRKIRDQLEYADHLEDIQLVGRNTLHIDDIGSDVVVLNVDRTDDLDEKMMRCNDGTGNDAVILNAVVHTVDSDEERTRFNITVLDVNHTTDKSDEN